MDKVELELNGTAWEYTGAAIRPSVSGWYKGQEIYARSDRYGTDAYKAYSNNISVGYGTVTFEGRGDFYGEKSIQFPIVPKSVKTVSATNTFANTIVLEWEAAAGAQYYNLAMKNSSGQWEIIQEKITACKAIVEGLSPNTAYSFSITTGADVNDESFEGLSRSEELKVKTESEISSKTENLITEISASVDGTQTTIAAKQISGKKYIYLPSCADLTALKLNISTSAEALTLMGTEGSAVYSDEAFDLTEIAAKGESGAYELMLQADESEPMKLYIMRAENIPAIFLTSDDNSAGRNYVDSAKGNSATANMLMLASSGSSVYSGHLKQVKSRGNSTFIYYDKKSYQIKLETPSDLLGTGESVKTWVLLAGYADATQMHDKLFKDLATNMELAYTASSDWVDLYYDGEYRGIYLLSEKNSVGKSSVNITDLEEAYKNANPQTYGKNMQTATGTNKYGQTYQYALNAGGAALTDPADITGGYLIERNLNEIDEACGFYTREGGGFNVKSPEYASENALKYISEYYQEFEDAVLAKDADGNYTGINPTTGKHYYEYCDKDSLVKIFMLQELAANCDGFLSSFYFYKDAGSGLMYAGPIWDQEITLGMSWSYTIDPTETRQYYLAKALIKIPDFAEAVKAYYQSDFQSLMTELIAENGKINAYAAKISNSAAMNYTMWPLVKVADPAEAEHLWESGTTYEKVLSNMREWLTYRINNLNVLYGDGQAHTEHSYVSEVTKPATTSEEGIRTYKCTVCGRTYTEKIAKISSGGGGGGVVVVPTTDTKTDDTGKSTATVKPVEKTEADGKKTTSATVDTAAGSKIVENAIASKSTEVVVNAATSKTVTETASGSKTEVAIPETTVSDLAEKTEAAVTIRSNAAEVTLDKETVKSIAEQTGTTGMVKLIVETVAQDEDKLQLELKLETSKGEVSDFKGGKASITVKLNSELAAKPVVCVYIDAHDVYHKVDGQKNANGTFTFKTGHFSSYAVMTEEKADKVIAEQAAKAEKLVKTLKLKARSAKTAKGNIKVTLTVDSDAIKAIEDLGYTVKYKFYRSTKKAASYKAATEKAGKTYTNTTGKKGTKYYYKARVMVYDAEGDLVAKSELKQCKYAARVK